ncbi:MAG: hypothetical protein ACM3SY_22515 [Candidatus Omnitrophota bacterium]
MKLKRFGIFFLGIVVIWIMMHTACTKKTEINGLDFALKLNPDTVTDFLYLKMNYRIKLTDEFKGLDNGYKVFVHLWRKKTKEMILQDDHAPDKPFSEWKKGDVVSYSRVVFIPQFIDEFASDFEGYEEARLTVGLYKPDSKNAITLFEKVFNIQSASLNAPEKVYDEGWYQPETDPSLKNPDERSWRWTGKRAVCVIANPRKESLLIIRGGVDKAILPDQKITFKINDTTLEEFVPSTAKFSKQYVIQPGIMGNEDDLKLVIEADKTFIPSTVNKIVKDTRDNRELGLQIYFLYFRENIK